MKTSLLPHCEVVEFSGMTCRIQAPGKDFDARATIIEIDTAPGAGAPPHSSRGEDKYFRILSGRFRFHVDGVEQDVSAGDFVKVARGSVHGFTNVTEEKSTLLLVSSPAGHDAFFRDMAALPLPHEMSAVQDVCARHDQEIVAIDQ